MCLAVPGEIISIDESVPELRMAKVNIGGNILSACIEWLPEAGLGDFVMVHAGMALSTIDKSAAEATMDVFRQITDKLDEEDARLASG